MHYFSLATLESESYEARRELRQLSSKGDAYRDHCLVWKLFPQEEGRRDFVFRRVERGRALQYYVVSAAPPTAVPGLLAVQSKPYQPRLLAGEWVRFELQANPTVSRKFGAAVPGQRRRSRRHDVLMDAKQGSGVPGTDPAAASAMQAAALDWLAAHAPQWGLRPQLDDVLTSRYTQHNLRSRGRTIAFSTLDYAGMAQVENPEALAAALTGGVGHARGFGCGLLLVRRME